MARGGEGFPGAQKFVSRRKAPSRGGSPGSPAEAEPAEEGRLFNLGSKNGSLSPFVHLRGCLL